MAPHAVNKGYLNLTQDRFLKSSTWNICAVNELKKQIFQHRGDLEPGLTLFSHLRSSFFLPKS